VYIYNKSEEADNLKHVWKTRKLELLSVITF